MTTVYTVKIEASDADRTIWQAVEPAETVDTADWGPNWTAKEVARTTAVEQNVADGDDWRVRVWLGADADTGTEPHATVYVEDVDRERRRYATITLSDSETADWLAGMPELAANGHTVDVDGNTATLRADSLEVLADLDKDRDGYFDGSQVWIGGEAWDVEWHPRRQR